jgi:hypothetical protein
VPTATSSNCGDRAPCHTPLLLLVRLFSLSLLFPSTKTAGSALGRLVWTRGKRRSTKWMCWQRRRLQKGLTRMVTLNRALDGGDWGCQMWVSKVSIGETTIEQGAYPQSRLFHFLGMTSYLPRQLQCRHRACASPLEHSLTSPTCPNLLELSFSFQNDARQSWRWCPPPLRRIRPKVSAFCFLMLV